MTDWRRTLRLFFKFGLLVCLPLTGYLWAQMGVTALTIGMSAACVALAVGAEGLASAAESRLSRMMAVSDAEEQAFQTEVVSREERIRQMDRIVETLSNQNHDLRGKLVSLHGETHRFDEELAERPVVPVAEPPAEAPAATEEEAEPASGEVTDINALRNRR
jgi:TolA-binding protein